MNNFQIYFLENDRFRVLEPPFLECLIGIYHVRLIGIRDAIKSSNQVLKKRHLLDLSIDFDNFVKNSGNVDEFR